MHRGRISNLRLALAITAGASLFLWWLAKRLDLEAIRRIVRWRYPEVLRISGRELQAWLESAQPPLVLDARSAEEYGVSHLPGAVRVTDGGAGLPKSTDSPIVVYCAVGYRSSALAARLQRAGFTRVFNLDGAIFQWANEGRPLVKGAQPVEHVHPYSSFWSRLVRHDRRASLPR